MLTRGLTRLPLPAPGQSLVSRLSQGHRVYWDVFNHVLRRAVVWGAFVVVSRHLDVLLLVRVDGRMLRWLA